MPGSDAERKRMMLRKKHVFIIMAICCLLLFIVIKSIPDPMSYSVEKDEDHWNVSIKGRNGETIYEESYELEPVITKIGRNTIMVTVGRGDLWISIFVNGKTGNVSNGFENISACNEKLVVYGTYQEGEMKIIIRDIYDESKIYKEITDDFPPVAVGSYII